MSASAAINLFVKAVLREKRIPFEITPNKDQFYSKENQAYILKSMKQIKEGKGQTHELIEEDDE